MKPISTTPPHERNYNSLQPNHFHKLVARVFEVNKNTKRFDCVFDTVNVPPSGSDEGVDIALLHNSKYVGNIQCKRFARNLDKPKIAKEIIRFVLYSIANPILINDRENFYYYLSVSTGVAKTANTLINTFNTSILKEVDVDNWISEELGQKSLEHLKTNPKIIEEVKEILGKIKVKLITPSNLDTYLALNKEIITEFFEIQMVVNNTTTEDSNKQLKRIADAIAPDVQCKIDAFKEAYNKAAINILEPINFIGYSTISKVKPRTTISKLYVKPTFRIKKSLLNPVVKKSESDDNDLPIDYHPYEDLSLHQLFDKKNNYIILGDPGAGKSLLVKYIMLQILSNELKGYENNLTFRIELRKYNEDKQKISIIDYLCQVLKAEYSINEISTDTLNQIIKNYQVIFFFDGLDEIFDVADKIDIRDRIQAFTNQNDAVKSIVTSRSIGYNDAPFNEFFEEVNIQDFNNNQVNEFITKLYKAHIADGNLRKEETLNCQEQISRIESDFKNNPLILSLMVLLAVNNFKIPESKLEVYRSCAETLSDKRDREEKQLRIDWKVKNKKGTFGHLAFWQYEETTQKNQITLPLALNAIAEYLKENNEYSNLKDAKDIAKNFLNMAELRSIYFENMFTHKTFLEYFAAEHILQTYHNDPDELNKRDEILDKYISNPYWSIVFELFFLMIDESVSKNKVLDKMITRQLKRNDIRVNSFFLNLIFSLKNVSSDVIERLLTDIIMYFIREENQTNTDNSTMLNQRLFMKLLYMQSEKSKRSVLFKEIIYKIEDKIEDDELKINYYLFCEELDYGSDFKIFLEEEEEEGKLYHSLKKKDIERLRMKNYPLYLKTILREGINFDSIEFVNEMVNLFGKKVIFMWTKKTKIRFKYSLGNLNTIFGFYINKATNLKTFKTQISKIKSFGFTTEEILEQNLIAPSLILNRLSKLIKIYLESSDNLEINKIVKAILLTNSYSIKVVLEHFSYKFNNLEEFKENQMYLDLMEEVKTLNTKKISSTV